MHMSLSESSVNKIERSLDRPCDEGGSGIGVSVTITVGNAAASRVVVVSNCGDDTVGFNIRMARYINAMTTRRLHTRSDTAA